jgi:hypothetical protein
MRVALGGFTITAFKNFEKLFAMLIRIKKLLNRLNLMNRLVVLLEGDFLEGEIIENVPLKSVAGRLVVVLLPAPCTPVLAMSYPTARFALAGA